MGPFDTISNIVLGGTGGPFTAFGSVSLEQLWAHMTLLAAFLFEKQLAHPQPSAVFFGSTNGHSQLSAACLWSNIGPI
jgi:hypothetical protein